MHQNEITLISPDLFQTEIDWTRMPSHCHPVKLKSIIKVLAKCGNPANIYLFKVDNRNARYDICSKLTIKTTKPCQ